MTVLGEKRGMDPWIDQLTYCGLCRVPFFLGAMALLNSVDDYVKGCCALIAWDMCGLGPYADWAWDPCGVLVGFPLQGVHWFESPQLLDMSNRLFAADRRLLINRIIFVNESWLCFTIITYLTTFVWLSSAIPCLWFNELSYMLKFNLQTRC
jgi:hypothetical protein